MEHQESAFFLLSQLCKLSPHLHEYFLSELLIIFSSVDVLLYGKIVDWLSGTFGIVEAQRLVSSAMVNWAGMPLEIEETVSYGHIIACRCGAPKPKGPEVEYDDEEEDDEDAYGKKSERGRPLPKFIEEVSATTAEQPFISGTILATIRVGDLVRLKSHSRLWWLLYEVRPASGTVLLCNKELRVRGNSGGKQREPKTEYREVKLSTLLGCMVRREGVLSAQTLKYQRRPDMSFQECLICTPKDAEKEGFVGANADAYDGPGSRRVSVLFQIPGPDLRASIARMRALTEEYPAVQTADDAKGIINSNSSRKAAAAPVEPLHLMQHQAQAKAFVARWEEAQRARQILSKMDPFSCVLARERWLLAARALKTISRGGTELLPEFIQLTKAAGREGQMRARDCRVAWECLRPATSADLPALSKARAYLKMRGAGKSVAFFDDAGRLRPETMEVSPLARGILEAAATFLADRNVVFLAQFVDQSKVSNDVALNIEAAALPVAGATYSHYLSAPASSSSSSSAAAGRSKGSTRTVFESVETVRAYLAPGDVIMVRGAVGEGPPPSSDPAGSLAAAAAKGYSWVQVLSVDLLFARLRVLPCAAPPECWYLPSLRPEAVSHAGSADTPACWLALSRVWDCTVCRLLPMASPSDATLRQGKHLVFVTPMPSPSEALAALAAFDKKTQAVSSSSSSSSAAPAAAVNQSLRASVVKSKAKGKGAAAVAAAANSRPGANKTAFSLATISYYTDAVIVAWTAVKILPAPFVNAQGVVVTPTAADLSVVYSLEVAHISSPYEWKLVYTGVGVGCQISGLEPLSQYYVRVTANASLPQTLAFRRGGPPGVAARAMEQERRRAQTLVTTLGTAVPAAPSVHSAWEKSSSGSSRALVDVFNPKRTILPPLPTECFYQIEVSLGAGGASTDDDDKGDNGSWAAVGRTRAPTCWIVGSFAGRTILLRTRVVNQMGQPGAASPVALVEVPSEPGQLAPAAAAAGRGLNDSALSDLTTQR